MVSHSAVRTLLEALRQESTDGVLRTTSTSPGYVRTDLVERAKAQQARRCSMSSAVVAAKTDSMASVF